MDLDQPSVAFLTALRAAGARPLCEQKVEDVRENVRAASLQLAVPICDVHQVIDQTIPSSGCDIPVRVYMPRLPDRDERLPLVVHFHGGGFLAGDLDTHDAIARYYSRHGDVVVIAVDYRRPPEHPFPAAIDDAYAAVAWAVAHAGELQGDASRVGVIGDSAGGTLSAVVCQLARERRGPAIAFQALVYPSVDFDMDAVYPSRSRFGGGEFFLSIRDMEWFRSMYLGSSGIHWHDPRVSPLRARDLTGLPPALVVTAGCDPLHDEGKAYADRLSIAGVPVEYRCFEQTFHAFMSFGAAIPVAVDALSFVASRLHAALHA